MIQNSINQMLGAIAIGGKLGQADTAKMVDSTLKNVKTNYANQKALQKEIDNLNIRSEDLKERLKDNKLTEEQYNDYKAELDEIIGTEKTTGKIDKLKKGMPELEKEMEGYYKDLEKYGKLKPIKSEVTTKGKSTFYKGLESDISGTLAEIERDRTLTKNKGTDPREDIIERNKQLRLDRDIQAKARMSMVRAARGKIQQSNFNNMTQFKPAKTMGELRKENWGYEEDYDL